MDNRDKLMKIAEGLNALNSIRGTYVNEIRNGSRAGAGNEKTALVSDAFKVFADYRSINSPDFGKAIERADNLCKSYRSLKQQYKISRMPNSNAGRVGIRQSLEYVKPAVNSKNSSFLDKSMRIYDILKSK